MLYIYISLISVLLFFSFILNNRTFISVSFIMNLMFLASAIILLLNNYKWKFEMGYDTCLIMVGALSMVLLGEVCARVYLQKKAPKTQSRKMVDISIEGNKITNTFFILSVLFIIITAILYYREFRRVVGQYGTSNLSMLASYRQAKVEEGVSDSILISVFKEASYCLCLFYIYVYIFCDREKKNLVPVALYSAIIIISSGRAQIIHIVSAAILMLYYSLENKNKKRAVMRKMMKYSFVGVIFFVGVFYFLGTITGKSSLYESVIENISVYFSSSYLAINEYLKEHVYSYGDFGSSTFFPIIHFFRKIGVDIAPNVTNNYLSYYYFPNLNHATNVYTYIGRLYHDFGSVGIFVVSFAIGWIYTRIEIKIRRREFTNNRYALLLYASYFYPITCAIFDFKFFDILSITGVVHIFVISILTKRVVTGKMIKQGVNDKLAWNNSIIGKNKFETFN